MLAVVDAPGMSTAELERALAAYPDADVLGKQAFIDARMEGIDTLMAIFVVLLALAVIVSLFGIVNALVLATFERRRELGTLQRGRHDAPPGAPDGAPREHRHRGPRGDSTGVAAGLGLGAVVTSLLADQGLTYVVPAGSLVGFAVVAVLAGVLAAVSRAAGGELNLLAALAYE